MSPFFMPQILESYSQKALRIDVAGPKDSVLALLTGNMGCVHAMTYARMALESAHLQKTLQFKRKRFE